MQNPANLCTPSAPAPARGLAVSATGERSGCTLSPHPWIPAHVAFQSMAICIGALPSLRSWPFMAGAAPDRAGFSPHESGAKAPEVANTPHGNHGDNLSKATGGVQ